MATEHLCKGRPEYEEGGDAWVAGPVAGCPYHDSRGRAVPKVKGIVGKREARAIDRRAGSLGTQRDGFVSGRDSGR